MVVQYLLRHKADVNAKGRNDNTPTHYLCYCALTALPEVVLQGFVLLLSHGAKLDIVNQFDETAIDNLEEDEPWVTLEMRSRYQGEHKTTTPAWKAHISLAERGRLKQGYLTKVAQGLLKTKQHKPLNTAFVDYVAQAGVEMSLVQQLRSRT